MLNSKKICVMSSILLFFVENIRQVNLIIEQGNSSTKVAIFSNGQLKSSSVFKHFDVSVVSSLFEEFDLKQGIFSTVIDVDHTIVSLLKSKLSYFLFLDEKVKLPVNVLYKSLQTLGKDRLAAVVGANYLKPEKDLLVIDAGTAITYEVIEASGTYMGGNISPGMSTRFKALHTFTKKLPLLSEPEQVPFIGADTESAIQAGVVNGIIFEMDGYIDLLRIKYPSLLVFLTGGHSFYFAQKLKNANFADINLVLTGLNRILEYNVEN